MLPVMQIGSSLLAAQQAAREAQARFHTAHALSGHAAPGGKPAQPATDASASPPNVAPPPANARPGSLLDIKV